MNSRAGKLERNLRLLAAYWLSAGRLVWSTSVELIARRKDGGS